MLLAHSAGLHAVSYSLNRDKSNDSHHVLSDDYGNLVSPEIVTRQVCGEACTFAILVHSWLVLLLVAATVMHIVKIHFSNC